MDAYLSVHVSEPLAKPLLTALVCELRTPLPDIVMGVCWVQETHSTVAAAVSMISALLPVDTGCSIVPRRTVVIVSHSVVLGSLLPHGL